MVDLSKILNKNKAFFLAYDQGMEHGPSDFDDENADPQYILDIGLKGGFTGIIFQKGVAEKYYPSASSGQASKLPLIIKLNGKTNLVKTQEPYSPIICTVDEAIGLGAAAVGYTVYVGSEHEEKMIQELGEIVREAHEKNIPVIGWMYPRGKNIKNPNDPDIIAYAARIGLEVGCDLVKVNYPGSFEAVKNVVEMAGKTGVIISGGTLSGEEEFLRNVETSILAGALGVAVGRNVWQREDPMEITKKLKEIVFKK